MNTAAGKNGNRTGFTDVFNPGASQESGTVSYCYDNADRLVSSSQMAPLPAGSTLIAGGGLSTVGGSLHYDGHGNTDKLADQTLSYDAADRHVKTVTDGGPTLSYVWGPGGDIVSRTSSTGEVSRFGSGLVLNGSNGFVQATVGLPGGASMIVAPTGVSGASWSYPNVHGDVVVTTDGAGARTGAFRYDPFGQPIDPITGRIGTMAADEAVPDTIKNSDADYAWLGGNFQSTGMAAAFRNSGAIDDRVSFSNNGMTATIRFRRRKGTR